MTDFRTGPATGATGLEGTVPVVDRQGIPGQLVALLWRFAELARYFLASAVALAVDAGTLVLCTEVFGLHYLVSATLGFSLGIIVIYALSVRWVFLNRSLADRNAERLIFITIGVIGLGLTDLVLYLLTDIAGLPYGLSKVGAAATVFTFNFGARKAALFRAPSRQGS